MKMKSPHRTTRWLYGAALIGSMTVGITAASKPKTVPECKVAAEWVKANGPRLPATLAELSRLPIAYRKAVVSSLPVEKRGDLWRQHFATFLTPASGLTAEQRAMIQRVGNGYEHFASTDSGAAELKALAPRIHELFTKDLGHKIFETLGTQPTGKETIGFSTASMSVGFVEDWLARQAAKLVAKISSKPFAVCDCFSGDDWCGGGLTCEIASASECDFQKAGCGSVWIFPCDGACH